MKTLENIKELMKQIEKDGLHEMCNTYSHGCTTCRTALTYGLLDEWKDDLEANE